MVWNISVLLMNRKAHIHFDKYIYCIIYFRKWWFILQKHYLWPIKYSQSALTQPNFNVSAFAPFIIRVWLAFLLGINLICNAYNKVILEQCACCRLIMYSYNKRGEGMSDFAIYDVNTIMWLDRFITLYHIEVVAYKPVIIFKHAALCYTNIYVNKQRKRHTLVR